jgi:hypothetical protein
MKNKELIMFLKKTPFDAVPDADYPKTVGFLNPRKLGGV